MSNERNPGFDASHLAGVGQQRGSSADEGKLEESVEEESRPSTGEEAHDREVGQSARSKELVRAADLLVAASDSELKEAGLGSIVSAAYSYQWSGIIPSPEMFNKYDAETRERICRWNDSFTVDESARQDRLVDNEIKQQDRGVMLTFILMAGFGVATFVAFLVTRDVASFGFLSIPLLNVLANLFRPAMSKSSRESLEDSRLNE